MKSVEKYNPTTDTWCEVSPMLTPRRGLGAAILDGILYVVGGSDGIAAVNQVNLFFRYLAIAIFQKLYGQGIHLLRRDPCLTFTPINAKI